MTLPPVQKKPSAAWRAYQDYRGRLTRSVQPAVLGEFEESILDGIEARAVQDPRGAVAASHAELLSLLGAADLHIDLAGLARAREIYDVARRATYPASAAYTDHAQGLSGLTYNASLTEVDGELLRVIDLLAHDDPTYKDFVDQMVAILAKIGSAPDIVAYKQFFEIYAEAMVLNFLRGRGIRTSRIKEKTSAPDFRCELEDGRPYFVEVKALDIVDGIHRHKQIMEAGLAPNIEIERQLREGRRIAFAESEVAPYRRAYGDTGYDAYSVKRIIDTLRDKSRGAFKPSQFELGPTFALAVVDRLILHGWKSALVPYYYDEPGGSGDCVSGVIWHAAFGRAGMPVMRRPEFEGKPSVEGYLDRDGLYVDAGQDFPGAGLVVLQRSSGQRLSYGLRAPGASDGQWSEDDSEEALHAMCHAWNDQASTRGFDKSRYKIEH